MLIMNLEFLKLERANLVKARDAKLPV